MGLLSHEQSLKSLPHSEWRAQPSSSLGTSQPKVPSLDHWTHCLNERWSLWGGGCELENPRITVSSLILDPSALLAQGLQIQHPCLVPIQPPRLSPSGQLWACSLIPSGGCSIQYRVTLINMFSSLIMATQCNFFSCAFEVPSPALANLLYHSQPGTL